MFKNWLSDVHRAFIAQPSIPMFPSYAQDFLEMETAKVFFHHPIRQHLYSYWFHKVNGEWVPFTKEMYREWI